MQKTCTSYFNPNKIWPLGLCGELGFINGRTVFPGAFALTAVFSFTLKNKRDAKEILKRQQKRTRCLDGRANL